MLGKLHYQRTEGMKNCSSPLLRRNIHRIEKGLVMQPRRNVFALDYLAETLSAYERACFKSDYSFQEITWAHSVLKEYFSIVDREVPYIQACYKRFLQLPELEVSDSLPYPVHEKVAHNVSYEELSRLVSARRSIRWFQQRKVERELIEKASLIALQAPSACNRQPYEFYVIDEDPLLRTLAKLPGGTAGFSDNIPCLVAIVGDLSNYPLERDRHVIYIDGALASMQFMLGLETLGLSSCPINWPEIYKQDCRVAQLLDLQKYQRVVMFIAVGYAQDEGLIPYSAKKSPQEVVRFIAGLPKK